MYKHNVKNLLMYCSSIFVNRASVENLTNDIQSLTEKVNSAVKNVDSVGREFKKQMADFLKVKFYL